MNKIASKDMMESERMVRFQRRWANKHYKGNNRRYPIYSVNFPVQLNEKVETKRQKDYDLKWAEQETEEEEVIKITLVRKKNKNPSPQISPPK